MSREEIDQIILTTLDNVNSAYNGGQNNTLTSTDAGEVNPGAAYIELVRRLLSLGSI